MFCSVCRDADGLDATVYASIIGWFFLGGEGRLHRIQAGIDQAIHKGSHRD